MNREIMEIRDRIKAKTPKFFKKIGYIAASVSGVAIAIQVAMTSANAIPPEWWVSVYPYLIGLPAGIVACAALTRDYGIKEQE